MKQGSCECGSVQFESEGPWRTISVCHCGQCRKTSGHLWAATAVPESALKITQDTTLEWRESSDSARRGFCNQCGSSLFYQKFDKDHIAIGPGALDGDTGLSVSRHIFEDDKGDYYDSPKSPAKAMEWDAPVPGSCECGAVKLTVVEEPVSAWICHCEQCRKASGYIWAGAQLTKDGYQVVSDKTLAWYQSTDVTKKAFCTDCGSTVFWWLDGRDAPAVSCGVLENPTGIKLEKHIFTSEMADYEVIEDDLPQAPLFDLEVSGGDS